MFLKKRKKVGLALSGGGARGYAHIGVYKAMQEEGLKPQVISGTSIGAIMGALIANGYSAEELVTIAREYGKARILNFTGLRLGLSSHKNIRGILSNLLPDSFEQLKMPLYVAASNLNTASLSVFHSGSLIDSLLASISIPIVFKPFLLNGNYYADGGLFKNLPASLIRKQCNILVGSHVNHLHKLSNFKSTTALVDRCIRIGIANTIQADIELCDIYIDPEHSSNYSVLNFKAVDEIIDIGYKAAQKVLIGRK